MGGKSYTVRVRELSQRAALLQQAYEKERLRQVELLVTSELLTGAIIDYDARLGHQNTANPKATRPARDDGDEFTGLLGGLRLSEEPACSGVSPTPIEESASMVSNNRNSSALQRVRSYMGPREMELAASYTWVDVNNLTTGFVTSLLSADLKQYTGSSVGTTEEADKLMLDFYSVILAMGSSKPVELWRAYATRMDSSDVGGNASSEVAAVTDVVAAAQLQPYQRRKIALGYNRYIGSNLGERWAVLGTHLKTAAQSCDARTSWSAYGLLRELEELLGKSRECHRSLDTVVWDTLSLHQLSAASASAFPFHFCSADVARAIYNEHACSIQLQLMQQEAKEQQLQQQQQQPKEHQPASQSTAASSQQRGAAVLEQILELHPQEWQQLETLPSSSDGAWPVSQPLQPVSLAGSPGSHSPPQEEQQQQQGGRHLEGEGLVSLLLQMTEKQAEQEQQILHLQHLIQLQEQQRQLHSLCSQPQQQVMQQPMPLSQPEAVHPQELMLVQQQHQQLGTLCSQPLQQVMQQSAPLLQPQPDHQQQLMLVQQQQQQRQLQTLCSEPLLRVMQQSAPLLQPQPVHHQQLMLVQQQQRQLQTLCYEPLLRVMQQSAPLLQPQPVHHQQLMAGLPHTQAMAYSAQHLQCEQPLLSLPQSHALPPVQAQGLVPFEILEQHQQPQPQMQQSLPVQAQVQQSLPLQLQLQLPMMQQLQQPLLDQGSAADPWVCQGMVVLQQEQQQQHQPPPLPPRLLRRGAYPRGPAYP